MAKSKVLLLVAVVVIIVIIIAAAGVFALGNKDNNGGSGKSETTYWFYIDYNGYQNETNTATNGWISADSNSVMNGLFEALKNNNISDNSIENDGWIHYINSVEPDGVTESWYTWEWKGGSQGSWEEMQVVLQDSKATTFYIGVTGFTVGPAPEYVTTITLDPNASTNWYVGGPFAAYTVTAASAASFY